MNSRSELVITWKIRQ